MPYRPRIGVPINLIEANQAFSLFFHNLYEFGCDPLQLDCSSDDLESLSTRYIRHIDALLIPGNPCSVQPNGYILENDDKTISIDSRLLSFQFALLKKALNLGMPILGICAGNCVINIFFEGTLIQHIPNEIGKNINHDIDPREGTMAHNVTIQDKTLLNGILGQSCENRILENNNDNNLNLKQFKANSWHQQAIDKLGQGLQVAAIAPDGVIEAVERISGSFLMGIQFHPEYVKKDDSDYESNKKIMAAFIANAKQYRYKQNIPKELNECKLTKFHRTPVYKLYKSNFDKANEERIQESNKLHFIS